MKKEGFRGFFNSKDGKLNVLLLFSLVLVFALSIVIVEAMTVSLFTPGTSTINGTYSNRNVNISFNATWGFLGPSQENVSNCTLYAIGPSALSNWGAVKTAIADGTALGPTGADNLIQNGSFGHSY